MQIIKITDENAEGKALECLKKGGILIYPTETCYGVGVNATDITAVTKVLEYKKRPEGKAISIGVSDISMAKNYVEINKTAQNFYNNFLPGPVTVVSKSKGKVDRRLESEKGTLGVRIPNYRFILNLIEKLREPITTTSANSAGKKTPYSIQDVLDNLSQKQKNLVDLIIDAGELPHNPPSTVIDTTTEELAIYRQGQLDPTKISKSEIRNSKNVEDTENIGRDLVRNEIDKKINKPIIFLLSGELGAGKTHLTKGVAKELGITQIVKSPTYNYVNEYKFSYQWSVISNQSSANSQLKTDNSKLYHFDAWRIQNLEDLKALEFENWFKPGNVIVIEWPTVIMNLDPKFFEGKSYIYVDFINLSDSEREVRIYRIRNR